MRGRTIWITALTLLLSLVSLLPVATAREGAQRAADADGDKVFDDLEAYLERDPTGRFPVIALFEEGRSSAKVAEVRRELGPFEVSYEYQTMPGMAASLTAGQIRSLAARADVEQVQLNAPLDFQLGTARAAVGVDKARNDFAGLDGNNEDSVTCGGVRQYCKDDVVVAVIDSGIDRSHVDLDGGKVLGGTDCSSETCMTGFWYVDGANHGTYVSSILAGEGDGNPALTGMAPGAALVSVKVGGGSTTSAAVDAGIEWVLANKDVYGIDLANLSLAGRDPSDGTDSTSRLTNKLAAAGITPFVAAGNGAPDPGGVSTPGVAKYSVTVGSMADPLDDEGIEAPGFALWHGSERGPTLDGRVKPDVVTHGVDVTAASAGNDGTGYKVSGGTSAAAPMAAGIGALMLDENPSLVSSGTVCPSGDTSLECTDGVVDSSMSIPLKDMIAATADDWGATGKDNEYGSGRLNGYAAIDAASPAVGSGGPPVPANRHFSGTLSGTGATAAHTVEVTSTTFPVTATVIMADRARDATTPNFNVAIRDPAGTEVASSAGSTSNMRQDVASFRPASTGTYTITVTSADGSGSYWLDVSYPGAPPTEPAPTPTPTTAPDAPSGLIAAPVSGSTSQIDLSWGNVSGESGYKIERSPDGVSGWVQVGTTGADATTYRDSGLTAGATYHYRVKATNAAGDSAPSNVASAVANGGDATAPTTPTSLKASSGRGKISLTWKASTDTGGSGLAGYKVFRSTSSGGTYTQIATTTTTSYADVVAKGITYWYYVVSYDKAGNQSAPSVKVSGKAT